MAMLVEILVTKDCPHEDAAINVVGAAAQAIGVIPQLVLLEVSTLDQARQRGFAGSPTIRVNGIDVDPAPRDQYRPRLACRVYRTTHGPSGVPEFDLIRAALEDARCRVDPA
jgi:hypothetical protein